jgi:hypothetical protein
MSDKNINNNVVKKAKSKLGFMRAGSLFLSGLGICFLLSYPGLCYIMKENEDKFNNEMNSLKSLINDQNKITTSKSVDVKASIPVKATNPEPTKH